MAGRLVPATGAGGPADDTVRAEERRKLARELNDIIAHHLANVALRTMGRLDTTDLAGLHKVLGDVNRATGAALVELRLLAHVLEDDPHALTPVAGVGAMTGRLMPSAEAERWQRRLDGHGRTALYQVPVAADLLPLSVQATLTRTFQVTGEVALEHAAADACCTVTVEIGATEVAVRSSTTLPPAPRDHQQGRDQEHELGRSLRGLRERVDLSHGWLDAAVRVAPDRTREWVVTLVLPLG